MTKMKKIIILNLEYIQINKRVHAGVRVNGHNHFRRL